MTTQKNAPPDPQNQGEAHSSLTKSAINIVADIVVMLFATAIFILCIEGARSLAGVCS